MDMFAQLLQFFLLFTVIFVFFLLLVLASKSEKSMNSKPKQTNTEIVNDYINPKRPENVLVPDNVKEKAQDHSTQNVDAKHYDTKYEKNRLVSQGYKKIGKNTYQKNDIEEKMIADNDGDNFNAINNTDDSRNSFNPINNKKDDDDDENPIKEL